MKNRRYGLLGAIAAGAAGILVGVLIALTSGANAASTPTASYGGYTGTDKPGPGGQDGRGGHAGESALSSTVSAKLRAEAVKAVPGGTVDRVERDSGDATYEAHMTKSDGSKVTVKFDKAYKVTGVEDGMGK